METAAYLDVVERYMLSQGFTRSRINGNKPAQPWNDWKKPVRHKASPEAELMETLLGDRVYGVEYCHKASPEAKLMETLEYYNQYLPEWEGHKASPEAELMETAIVAALPPARRTGHKASPEAELMETFVINPYR